MCSYFPHIFGPSKDLSLDKDSTFREFDKLTDQVNAFLAAQPEASHPMTREEVAMGFIRVANETMCRPIRALTQVSLSTVDCCVVPISTVVELEPLSYVHDESWEGNAWAPMPWMDA